jgi:cytochrome d ubiquinol oxidase subunit II
VINLWFSIVVLAWVLFFVLEGFDFGVGILGPLLGRDDHERGAALTTIGPFWDGNEVWLVAAIGATFAAFPGWYAALLSGLYLPVAALLLLLAVRGVALEFRGKRDSRRWRRGAEVATAVCSAGIVALWGAMLAVFVRGLSLDPTGSVMGHGLSRSLSPIWSTSSLLGALAALFAAVLLGSTFLSLRTSGPVRRRARSLARWSGTFGAIALLIVGVAVLSKYALIAALVAFVVATLTRMSREGLAFALTALGVAGSVVAVFTANGSVVLPSTLNPAWSLTMTGTAASSSALGVITAVGVVVLPGVLAYQAFSYWVFRRRVASERVSS